jgi:hypothetical protein
MRVLSQTLMTGLLLAFAGPIGAETLSAQDNFVASRFYFALGAGAGFFTPTCETDCVGERLGANSLVGYVGFGVTSRLRVEAGMQRTQSTDDGSGTTGGYYASSTSVGLAFYPMSNLYVRGGVLTRLSLEVPDAAGNPLNGKDRPGYHVGAGYDFHIRQSRIAITPYVSVFGGSLDEITYDDGSGTLIETSGSAIAVHGGVFFTYRPRPGLR